MFGNNNNFNQFSSFQQRDVLGSINAPYSPQNIVNDALKQTPFRGTINSSSDCMKGYNPHNLSHEYHVANGGCVSDAQKAEAKALGQVGSGILGAAEYAAQNKAVAAIAGTVCAVGAQNKAVKFVCSVGVGFMSSEAIDSAKAFVKAKIANEIKSIPGANSHHDSITHMIFLCTAQMHESKIRTCIQEQRKAIPELAGVSEDFLVSYIQEEYQIQLAGHHQHHHNDGCTIL